MGGCQRLRKRPFNPSPSGSGPFPVSAVFNPGTGVLAVTFNEAITATLQIPFLWTLRFGGSLWEPDSVIEVLGATISLQMFEGTAEAGPNVCGYNPPPFDIKSTATAEPAAGFGGFAVT